MSCNKKEQLMGERDKVVGLMAYAWVKVCFWAVKNDVIRRLS